MMAFEAALQNLAEYPRWFVALCTIVVAGASLWVLAKVIKWTVYVVASLALGCVVVGALVWWLG
jgi:hypothetical protein